VRKKYQTEVRKSNHKFEVERGQELLVRVPLPMAEVWAEMQAQVEERTGQAGLQILRAIPRKRSNQPSRTSPSAESRRWVRALGQAAGLRVFCWPKGPAGAAAGAHPRR
jgi:hypothetical protein